MIEEMFGGIIGGKCSLNFSRNGRRNLRKGIKEIRERIWGEMIEGKASENQRKEGLKFTRTFFWHFAWKIQEVENS